MKKFSKSTGEDVKNEPKVETKVNEEVEFKSKIFSLMERFLSIQTYGPIDRYLRAGTISIAGKEMFMEALMDVLKDKSLKDETKILESLKSTVSDWESLDRKIDEAKSKITDDDRITLHRNVIKSIYNNYGHDEELLLKMVDESCNKIEDFDTANLRYVAAESMISDKKIYSVIAERFKNRSKEIKNGI